MFIVTNFKNKHLRFSKIVWYLPECENENKVFMYIPGQTAFGLFCSFEYRGLMNTCN